MEARQYKLKRDYSLGSVTVLSGSNIKASEEKAAKLVEAGFIAKPRKKKSEAPEEAAQ